MNLLDGHISYPQFSIPEFMEESLTWRTGLHGVICDNAGLAYSDLATILINYNLIQGRSLSVYNFDSDTMIYYNIDPERFPLYFDGMYRIEWRDFAAFNGQSKYPSINQPGQINMDYLKHKHMLSSSYGLIFLSTSSDFVGVDSICSQIAFDYTYKNVKNMSMKRTSNSYYVYDQSGNNFYKMH